MVRTLSIHSKSRFFSNVSDTINAFDRIAWMYYSETTLSLIYIHLILYIYIHIHCTASSLGPLEGRTRARASLISFRRQAEYIVLPPPFSRMIIVLSIFSDRLARHESAKLRHLRFERERKLGTCPYDSFTCNTLVSKKDKGERS